MFSCECPRCHGLGEGEDHTTAITSINHDPACGFMHGLATTFNAQEGSQPPKEEPKVEEVKEDEAPKVETPPEETQPVEMTSGETAEQK